MFAPCPEVMETRGSSGFYFLISVFIVLFRFGPFENPGANKEPSRAWNKDALADSQRAAPRLRIGSITAQ